MSSIIACRLPPASSSMPSTRRGVLSSEDSPIDWASLLAGSTVSTPTCLPRGAQADRGRRGGLADAAGAAADDDPGAPVVDDPVDVQAGVLHVHAAP